MDNIQMLDDVVAKLKLKVDKQYAAAMIMRFQFAADHSASIAKINITKELTKYEVRITVSKTVGGYRTIFRKRQLFAASIGLKEDFGWRIVSRKYVEQVLLKDAVKVRVGWAG